MREIEDVPAKNAKRRRRIVRSVFFSAAVIAIVFRSLSLPTDDALLRTHRSAPASFRGIIIDDPEDRGRVSRFTVDIQSIDGKKITDPEDHLVLLRSEPPADDRGSGYFSYGDEIEFSAILEKPEIIEGTDGRDFDYARYLSKDNIFYIAEGRNASVISRDNRNAVVASLFEIKRAFVSNLNQSLPSPHSFLAGGLVISGKGSLDEDLQDQFQKAGLIHIVVLSGFNISVIGEAIMRAVSFLPKAFAGGFGAASIILFSIMTGAGATVVRSALMSIIGIYARLSGKTNSALASLFAAALLMLVHNPKLAAYDPSFQLSFTATLGLILYADPIERLLRYCLVRSGALARRIPEGVIALASSTLATQIFTLPLIMRFSGLVSIVALPVNILVLPLIPLTMLFVCLTGAVSFISGEAAMLPAFVSWILLSYELLMVRISSSLPFSSIQLPPVVWKAVFAGYGAMIMAPVALSHAHSSSDVSEQENAAPT